MNAESTTSRHSSGAPSMGDYDLGRTIGNGAFSRVLLAKHKKSGIMWAVKILKKVDIVSKKQTGRLLLERNLLANLAHPFIADLAHTFQDKKCIFFVYEYISGGELLTYLNKSCRFDEIQAQFFSAQVALIFKYLHMFDTIYRDLRPENILIDKKGFVKLINFGFAKRITFKTYTMCGIPEYMAPEVLTYSGHSREADWWTLGVFIFELITGRTPFYSEGGEIQIYNNILAGRMTYPNEISKDAKALIAKLLVSNVQDRFGCSSSRPINGCDEVLSHHWFRGIDKDALLERNVSVPFVPLSDDAGTGVNFETYPEESMDSVPEPKFSDLFKDPFTAF